MIVLLLLAMQPATSLTKPNSHVDQMKLDVMSDACNAPRAWLRHIGGDDVSIQPAADAKYEMVDCLLAQLKRSPLKMKLGFIGNEVAPKPEKK